MIVVDANVVASLVLPTSTRTEAAIALLRTDRHWAAPVLWRSELTNILATGARNGWFTLEQALEALSTAEEVMDAGEYRVPAPEVLRLADRSRCTGYDAEYVALAHDLGVKLATLDRQLLRAFPEITVSLDAYGPAPADRADPRRT